MKKLFMLTAFILMIAGCDSIVKPERQKNQLSASGTIDVTAIKIGNHVFSKNTTLKNLKA